MAEEENKLNVKHHVYLKATATLHKTESYSIQQLFYYNFKYDCKTIGLMDN